MWYACVTVSLMVWVPKMILVTAQKLVHTVEDHTSHHETFLLGWMREGVRLGIAQGGVRWKRLGRRWRRGGADPDGRVALCKPSVGTQR